MSNKGVPAVREEAPQDYTSKLYKAIGYIFMLIAVAGVLVPIYWIVLASFKEAPDIYTQQAEYCRATLGIQ